MEARKLKKLGTVPLPTAKNMKENLAALSAKREKLLAEYKTGRNMALEHEIIKQDVDTLLSVQKEQTKENSYS